MGQCYSVTLTARLKDADEFVRLSRDYAKLHGWAPNYVQQMTSIDGIIKSIIPDRHLKVMYLDGWPSFFGGFYASYSWNGVMEDWFRAVAPSLVPGSEIEVWPGSGSWKCVVDASGGVGDTEYREDDEEEEDDCEDDDEYKHDL